MICIGSRLKQLRIDNKLTQQQVADLFGLVSSSISSYEPEYRNPSIKILIKYALHFQVSIDYILDINRRTYRVDNAAQEITALKQIVDMQKQEIERYQKLLEENGIAYKQDSKC